MVIIYYVGKKEAKLKIPVFTGIKNYRFEKTVIIS